MNEIKVGDIVRVSEDVPKIYLDGYLFDWCEENATVVVVDGEDVCIRSNQDEELAIPTKYLIKVNAEPRKPKYKIGQWVEMPDGDVAVITNVDNSSSHPYSLFSVKKEDVSYDRWSDDDLKPYTEPKEPTIAEELAKPLDFKKAAEDWANIIYNAQREYGENTCRIMEEGSVEAYWDVYTADLAKELVLKIAGSQLHNHKPQEIGRMAVEIAKSVAENLKEK